MVIVCKIASHPSQCRHAIYDLLLSLIFLFSRVNSIVVNNAIFDAKLMLLGSRNNSNASEQYQKGKRQNTLREGENGEPNDIQKIVETYQHRPAHIERYARRVSMEEIVKNGYNLNISRYVSTTKDEIQIDLNEVNSRMKSINEIIQTNTDKHNEFLRELGLPTI